MGNNEKSTAGYVWVSIIIVLFIILIASCEDSSSDHDSDYSYDSNYSYDYKTDKEYRNNVNDIAGVYGEDPEVVDRKIQAAADAMNE